MTKAKAQTKSAPVMTEQVKASIAIETRIVSLQKAFSSSMDEAQEIALSILQHVETYGECSLANKLVKAIPSSSQSNALKRWFMAFGRMTYSMKRKELVFKKDFATDIEGARQVKFWKFEKEQKFSEFDLQTRIKNLIKAAQAAANDEDLPEGKKHKIDPELLAKLEALAV